MIKIICVGKIKEKWNKEAIEEYIKRIKKYTQIEIIEVPDTKTDDEKLAIKKEKEEIEKHITSKDYLISLAIEGEQLSSTNLAKFIDKTQINYSKLVFVIGGSCGISEEIKKRSNKLLSFSRLTFPHQLFRILLLEQIYRAYKINNNESYHK